MRLVRTAIGFCAFVLLAACNAGHDAPPLPASNPALPNAQHLSGVPVAYGPRRFEFTGAPQSYAVPSGVTSVTIEAWGAGAGGRGGYTKARVPVTAGEMLAIIVGGKGEYAPDDSGGKGGYGGGGEGGRSSCCKNKDFRAPGAGGGGASTVLHADGSYAVVAGGGGGSSGAGGPAGAGGGATGGDAPNPYRATGGKGGGQTCGHPSAGSRGNQSVIGGGGGGGGYCGGQGGLGSRSVDGRDAEDTGGGGGSGFFQNDATGNPTTVLGVGNYGDGLVIVTPTPRIFTIASVSGVQEVAVDREGDAYLSGSLQHSIQKIAFDGTSTQVGTGLTYPEGVAVDDARNVYVADGRASYDDYGAIKKISPPFNTPTNGTITTLVRDKFSPLGLALDFQGHIYLLAKSEGVLHRLYWALRRIDLSNNTDTIVYWDYTQSVAGNPNTSGYAVAVDPTCVPSPKSETCGAYVSVRIGGNDGKRELWRIAYDGQVTKIPNSTLGLAPSSGVAASAGALYVANAQSKAINIVRNGVHSAIGSGWSSPSAIAVPPSGCGSLCSLYVIDGGTLKAYVP